MLMDGCCGMKVLQRVLRDVYLAPLVSPFPSQEVVCRRGGCENEGVGLLVDGGGLCALPLSHTFRDTWQPYAPPSLWMHRGLLVQGGRVDRVGLQVGRGGVGR